MVRTLHDSQRVAGGLRSQGRRPGPVHLRTCIAAKAPCACSVTEEPCFHRTLWFDNPSGKQTLTKFGQGLRPVYTFDTVEDFWWWVHVQLLDPCTRLC